MVIGQSSPACTAPQGIEFLGVHSNNVMALVRTYPAAKESIRAVVPLSTMRMLLDFAEQFCKDEGGFSPMVEFSIIEGAGCNGVLVRPHDREMPNINYQVPAIFMVGCYEQGEDLDDQKGGCEE